MSTIRIAIPSDNEVTVAAHTGRCRGFVVYDLADGKAARLEYRPNTFTAHHQGHGAGEQHQHGHGHEHGHSHAGILNGLSDCQAMIAVGMGRRLIEDLRAVGMRVFFADEPNIHSVAQKAAAGELKEIPLDAACHGHQHGHDQ